MGNAMELPGCISTVQTLGEGEAFQGTWSDADPFQVTFPTRMTVLTGRRLYQAGASFVAMARRMRPRVQRGAAASGYAFDTWD